TLSPPMEKSIDRLFLDHSVSKLNQLAGRIEACLAKLNDEQVWARGAENENAIGNLVLHLCGNLRQWILSGVGGQPDNRDRDAEFNAHGGVTVAALAEKLRRTVDEAATVIAAVTPDRLTQRHSIQ